MAPAKKKSGKTAHKDISVALSDGTNGIFQQSSLSEHAPALLEFLTKEATASLEIDSASFVTLKQVLEEGSVDANVAVDAITKALHHTLTHKADAASEVLKKHLSEAVKDSTDNLVKALVVAYSVKNSELQEFCIGRVGDAQFNEDQLERLPTEALVLILRLSVMGTLDLGAVPPFSFSGNMRRLLKSQKEANFTVKFGTKEYKLHKEILAVNSSFFKAMLSHSNVETDSSVCNLSTDEIPISEEGFELMLELFYCVGESEVMNAKACFEVLLVAEYFGITNQQLIKTCEDILSSSISPENCVSLLVLAHKHGEKELKEQCIATIVKNFDEVKKQPEFAQLDKAIIDEIHAKK